MVDFSAMLKKPAGLAKKPPALAPGDYPGIIKSFETGDANKNKTPYVRFHLGLMGWPESVASDEQQQDGVPIDLAKRPLRRDFFMTDDALWRLDEFIKSCGVAASGKSYEEVLPMLVGQQVTVEVQQYMNQSTSDIGNQVGKLIGQSA